jgi:hypothetical protein
MAAVPGTHGIPGPHITQQTQGPHPLEAHLAAMRNRAAALSGLPYGAPIPPETGGLPPAPSEGSAAGTAHEEARRRMPTVAERVAPLHLHTTEAHRLAAAGPNVGADFTEAQRLGIEGGRRSHEGIGQYLSTHQQHVMESIRRAQMENLTEHLLPQLRKSFIKAGHRGGESQKRAEERLLRNVQRDIGEQQALLAHRGYEQALQASHYDSARQLESAKVLQQLGINRQAVHAAQIAALREAGATEHQIEQLKRDLAYEEWKSIQRHPYDMLNYLASIIHGQQYTPSTYTRTEVPKMPSSLRGRDWADIAFCNTPRFSDHQ